MVGSSVSYTHLDVYKRQDTTYTVVPAGTKTMQFTINAQTTCDKTFPIACCR